MFKILNRFAWILSFCFSSLIFYYLAPDGTRFLFIIPFLIVAFLIKGVFLSSNFIKTNLEGFVEKLMLESAKLKDNNLVSNQQQQTVGITDQEKLEENYLDLAQTSQELKSENIQNIDMKIPNDIKVNYIFSEIPPKEEDTAKQQDYSPTEVQKEP